MPAGAWEPCDHRARARRGDEVVAESDRAMWLDLGPGQGRLAFPAAEATEGTPIGELPGHVELDGDDLVLELVDDGVDVVRFPPWGDAAHLIDVLDVRPTEDGAYESVTRGDPRRDVVEASQVLGQAIVAASRHAPGRRVASAHLVMARVADATEPLRFELDEVAGGRTFTSLVVHVSQRGRRCAAVTVLLGVTAPDVVRHEAPAPAVAGPGASEPHDMAVAGRALRVVDGAYTGDPDAPVGPPVIDAWVRFRSVPDDPALHAGLLAQFTGHMAIAAALRPHAGIGQAQAHVTLSTAINAIAVSFHSAVRADRWMLYRHLSTHAGDGMTHAECRVHDEAGALLASFTVDAMVRAFAGGAVGDAATSL